MKLKFATKFAILFTLFLNTYLTAQNTIQLTIKNIGKDSIMIAYYLGDKQYIIGNENGTNEYIKFDKNGEGTFKMDNQKKGFYMFVFPPKNEFIEFLYDDKDLEIYLDRAAMQETIAFKNSAANQLFYEYVAFLKDLTAEKERITNDKDEVNKEGKLKELDLKQESFLNELISNNMSNLGAKFLKASIQVVAPNNIIDRQKLFDYYKANFFNNVNFNDEWLNRTPFFHNMLMVYLDKLTEIDPLEIAKSVDYIIDLSVHNDEMYQYIVTTFLNKYAKSNLMIGENVYAHIVAKYYASGKATRIQKEQLDKILTSYNNMKKSIIGVQADNFEYILQNKQSVDLFNQNSKFKILYFWSPPFNQSDLKITKKELPENVQFLSISKSFDSEQRDDFHKKYPQEFPLYILSPENQEKVFASYNIQKNSTSPSVFVLDESNHIIAKRITATQALDVVSQSNNKK
jgi:hypothetical protein